MPEPAEDQVTERLISEILQDGAVDGNYMKIEILRMDNVSKILDGTPALHQVNFSVFKGEIHGIIGENGAGKSTMVNVLTGTYHEDKGSIYFCGKEMNIEETVDAVRVGISCVQQEMRIVPAWTVAENIFLLNGTSSNFWHNRKQMNHNAIKFLEMVGLSDIDPNRKILELSLPQKRLIELARAISSNPQMIILDEITSAMNAAERSVVFQTIKKLAGMGITFIFVSHNINEIMAISDHITIMRDGCTVLTVDRAHFIKDRLIALMVGRRNDEITRQEFEPGTDVVLSMQNISTAGKLHNMCFELKHGEILGFIGQENEGKEEIVEVLFGIRPKISGQIRIDGTIVKIQSPWKAVKLRIGFLPSNRLKNGLLPEQSVNENITLPILKKISFCGFINGKLENHLVGNVTKPLNIRTLNDHINVRYLSGGNQQKVIVARWIAARPKVLILMNPTQGVDMITRREIIAQIKRLADEGISMLLISSEPEELYELSHRILEIRNGKENCEWLSKDLTLEILYEIESSISLPVTE